MTDTTTAFDPSSARRAIIEDLTSRAESRRRQAEKVPDEPRHAAAATALASLADHVEALDITDRRLVAVSRCGAWTPDPGTQILDGLTDRVSIHGGHPDWDRNDYDMALTFLTETAADAALSDSGLNELAAEKGFGITSLPSSGFVLWDRATERTVLGMASDSWDPVSLQDIESFLRETNA